jgi:hypothetical protein
MQDPAAGTAGFIIAVDKYIKEHTTEQLHGIDSKEQIFQFRQKPLLGMERISSCNSDYRDLMNCMLHGIEIDAESPILLGDTLGNEGLKLPKSDIIITNPPFGGKKNGEPPLRIFPYPTSNQTLLFLQHVYLSLNPGGRAAVVVPDNVLFEEGIGQKVRVDLMEKCDLHTILRLPTGIFNLRGVKTNVLFFTKGITETGNTKDVWVYDLRTNMPPFGKVIPFTREHLTEFEKAYGDDPFGKSKRKDEGDSGRFRRFSRSEIREEKKENLDILWLDSNEQDGVEKEATDSDINKLMDKPFDPTKINIETKTPSLDTLIKRIQRKTVQLNTESYFQRKDDLWDKRKQSRLIESILIKFPLPAFFFDATDDNNWLVVDGLQRLSSIRNFAVNKTLKLTNLEFLTHLNGKGWDEIGDLQSIIEESQVVIYKIMPGTPTDVKFNIFKRINTGGLVLESQEIRHALFQGKPAEFIAELAITEEFIEATAGKIKTHRMLDRDFANRFLCFYLFGYDENYGSKEYGLDLDTYMSKAMASIYSKTQEELEIIRENFKESMKLAKDIFGKKAFRKVYEDEQRLPPINKAIFDAISVQFAILSIDERNALREKKDVFEKALLRSLNEDELFFMSVTSSTSDKNRVYKRHKTIKELIWKTIKG